MTRMSVLAGGLAVALLGAPGLGRAQDCGALIPIEGPTGYQARNASGRCEGIFAARVAGGGIELVSLTAGPVAWDSAKDRVLTIEPAGWTPTGGTHLRAVGIPAGLYYRLDATLFSSSPFRLPLDAVLRPERIGPEDFGIFAFRALPGRAPQYLPVQVLADGSRSASSVAGLIATLRPSEPVSAVRARLVPAIGEAPAYTALPGAAGLVPAGRRLDVPLGSALPGGSAVLFVAYTDLVSGQERVERFDLATR